MAAVTILMPKPGGRKVHPLGEKCEARVQKVADDMRRLDAEQIQVVEIIVAALLRGAL